MVVKQDYTNQPICGAKNKIKEKAIKYRRRPSMIVMIKYKKREKNRVLL